MSENLDGNFEEKLIKANEILNALNDENLSLDQSLKLHNEGKKLLKEAENILQNAKLVIQEVSQDD
ncbi:MAG: exodeoxyribonuclease VII small subunit [Campylobacter sp.]